MSTTPTPLPTPESQPFPPKASPPEHKGVLWKWSLGMTGVIMLLLLWQCGSGLYEGRNLSAQAVHHFHEQLNAGDYSGMWERADEGFRTSGKMQDFLDLIAAIHRKLGNASSESLDNINVSVTTSGTYITAVYSTQFESGPGTETFVWKRDGTQLKLFRYNINSKALILK